MLFISSNFYIMFNEIILASVNSFNQGTPDKNGKMPVILNVIAGKSPNRLVLSGTVAESIGLVVGKSFLMQVREVEADAQYGRQFNHQVLSEVTSALDLIKASKELGTAQVFSIDAEGDAGSTANGESMTVGTQSETPLAATAPVTPVATPIEND